MTQTQPTAPPGGSTLAPYLPRLLLEWAHGGAGERRREVEGSLVSVDISGFTSLSERLAGKGRIGAEELILLISGVFEGLIGVAYRSGGDVLKFRGDALLLFFAGESHEERACDAANGMQWFIETAGSTMSSVGPVELRMSAGVYSGACQFFLVDASHQELVVCGPAATRTFELEDASQAGEILVSARTAEALPTGMLAEERDGARLLVRREPEPAEEGAAFRPLEVSDSVALEEYVPVPLREHLAVASGEAEHRQVTVAFVKFSDTDEILRRDGADALAAKLQALGEALADTCATYGVTWLESDIDRGAGKAYLTAGAPFSTGADEEAMLRTLRDVFDGGADLPLRAGVNRGRAFAGDIGASTRRTYAVMGDVVNLGARLCGRAEVGEILATGDVLERSRSRFETKGRTFRVKGKSLPVTGYTVGELTGLRDEEATGELPLVGRESEVTALRAAIDSARSGDGRVVELIGDPGIGKSRLVQELRSIAAGFQQLEARCERYAQSTPFFAWRNVLRRLAGIEPDASRDEAGLQVTAWIETVLPELAPWLPLLAVPLDAEVASTPEAESIDEAFRLERLNDTVEEFLRRAITAPTLFILEDAHWMDDASRHLLRRVAAAPTQPPWLVCVTTRPGSEEIVRDGTAGLRLALEPLSQEDAARLALAAAEEFALTDDTVSALAERSGGNPLFVRELIAVSRAGGSLEALPESVETLMTTRIDTLPATERLLLRYAAVVGPRFDLSLLSEILGDEVADTRELTRWQRLSDFVAWEGTETLAFRHDLFRATAYEGLSFRRRREIHGRVGAALEERAGERVEEAAALLSLHFYEARRFDKAWRYAVSAGTQAEAMHANVVAGELYERALGAAESLDLPRRDVAQIWEALGAVAQRYADFGKAAEAYEGAASVVGDDPIDQARLALKRGQVVERGGDFEGATEWYRRALAAIENVDSDGARALRAQLQVATAGIRHREGRFEDAIELALEAARQAEAAGDRRELAHAYYLIDMGYTRLGRPEHTYRDLALPIYEEIGDLVGQANVLNNLGIDLYFEGGWTEALDAYQRSSALRREAGDVVGTAMSQNNEAEVRSDQGHLEQAEPAFQAALRTWRAASFPIGVALATSNLGRVAARSGRFDDAHRLYADALAGFEEIGSPSFARETKARIAECFVLEGRHREAEELAGGVLADVIEAGDPGVLGAMLERLLGYGIHQRGDAEGARAHFEVSLRYAREVSADYEAALTLKAIADTGTQYEGDAEGEYRKVFSRLGIVSVPSPPLP